MKLNYFKHIKHNDKNVFAMHSNTLKVTQNEFHTFDNLIRQCYPEFKENSYQNSVNVKKIVHELCFGFLSSRQ